MFTSSLTLRSVAYTAAYLLGIRRLSVGRYTARRARNAAVLLTSPILHTPDCLPQF